jgi:hypothetical protein
MTTQKGVITSFAALACLRRSLLAPSESRNYLLRFGHPSTPAIDNQDIAMNEYYNLVQDFLPNREARELKRGLSENCLEAFFSSSHLIPASTDGSTMLSVKWNDSKWNGSTYIDALLDKKIKHHGGIITSWTRSSEI